MTRQTKRWIAGLGTTAGMLACACLMMAAVAGCAEDDHDHDDSMQSENTLDSELCEHMTEGPALTLEASTNPDVSMPHHRHDITLTRDSDSGMFMGSVSLAADEAGHYVVAMDKDVPVVVMGSDGTTYETEGLTNAVCSGQGVAKQFEVELPVGTVQLNFGPTEESVVLLVIEHEEEEGHDHDEDGHDHDHE